MMAMVSATLSPAVSAAFSVSVSLFSPSVPLFVPAALLSPLPSVVPVLPSCVRTVSVLSPGCGRLVSESVTVSSGVAGSVELKSLLQAIVVKLRKINNRVKFFIVLCVIGHWSGQGFETTGLTVFRCGL